MDFHVFSLCEHELGLLPVPSTSEIHSRPTAGAEGLHGGVRLRVGRHLQAGRLALPEGAELAGHQEVRQEHVQGVLKADDGSISDVPAPVPADLAAVCRLAAAPLASNPEQLTREGVEGYSAVAAAPVGFTVGELMVLDWYRRRTCPSPC